MREALSILGAMLVPVALAYFGVIGGLAALVLAIAILLVAAWNVDRGRRPGAREPFVDAAHPDFPVPMAGPVRPNPTETFESPSDRRGPT